MERTGFQRELRDREVDVECRGFGPSFNMDNTHYHDCFEVYFQISGDRNLLSGGRFHHLEPGSVLWIPQVRPAPVLPGAAGHRHPGGALLPGGVPAGGASRAGRGAAGSVRRALQVMRLDVFQRRKALELLYELEQGSRAGQELYARFVFGQLVLLLRPGPGRGAPCPGGGPHHGAPSTTG